MTAACRGTSSASSEGESHQSGAVQSGTSVPLYAPIAMPVKHCGKLLDGNTDLPGVIDFRLLHAAPGEGVPQFVRGVAMSHLGSRIEAALGTFDNECRWELIDAIVTECPDDVFDASRELLHAGDERSRVLGADILGRLVTVDQGQRMRVSRTLRSALATERDPSPVASIVAALGHVGDPATLDLVFPLVSHACAEVRLAVAFAVATLSLQPLGPQARVALIRLSRDDNSEVRDWATHALGTLSDADGPEIRAALLARADDDCHEARAEALFGLAVRRDPRAVPHLIRALQSPHVHGLEVDAAAAAGDPRLLPALWALKLSGLADGLRLRRAIDRCSSSERPPLA